MDSEEDLHMGEDVFGNENLVPMNTIVRLT